MNGETRREELLKMLNASKVPLSGAALAEKLNVTRQIIVQDVALLRANGKDILSTTRGYVLSEKGECTRIFKLIHTDEDAEDELKSIVDLGGRVKDVFVYHKVYNVVKAEMNIRSRKDITEYMNNIRSGKSSLLKNVTSGYHYHTVAADDEKTLDEIEAMLRQKGYFAKLIDYEPVDFWSNAQEVKNNDDN